MQRIRAPLIAAALVALGPATAWGASQPFDCVIEASLVVKLGSPVANIVADVTVERGDVVAKGQPVAHIESSAEQAAVAYNQAKAESTAEIQAKQAVMDQKAGVLRRKIGLQKENIGAAQDVENAQAEFNVAKQEAELAKLNHAMAGIEAARAKTDLALRTIRSPIDGVVTQRSIGPGEYFHQESTIVTIARIDPLNVEAYLPVRYYKLIKVGDEASVFPNEPVGGERKAKVSVVDQVFDAASGTYGVRLEMPNPDHTLPAGLRCHVTFEVADPARPACERQAVTPRDHLAVNAFLSTEWDARAIRAALEFGWIDALQAGRRPGRWRCAAHAALLLELLLANHVLDARGRTFRADFGIRAGA